MKTIFTTLLLCIVGLVANEKVFSQCDTTFKQRIALSAFPSSITPGKRLSIVAQGNSTYQAETLKRFYVTLNGQVIIPAIVGNQKIEVDLPNTNLPTTSSIFVCVDDGPFGEVFFTVSNSKPSDYSQTNGSDPNPLTQHGDTVDAGKNPKPLPVGGTVHNPPGGRNTGSFDCDSIHRIDGKFTDSVYKTLSEWSGITPLYGRFSNLYLDYCPKTQTMYLLNDWYLGTGNYDSSSCYNLFQFTTANGLHNWEIRVYHSTQKPIQVILNGTDVSTNASIVLKGVAGFGSSPLYSTSHTIYEFGVRTSSGLFFMAAQDDPYRPPVGGSSTTTICDEKGKGWGLVREPMYYAGMFSDSGTVLRTYNRYIPLSGIYGLEKEPNPISGTFTKDSSTIGITGGQQFTNYCNAESHVVDGQFSEASGKKEWQNSKPAIGRYSNFYADYCNGKLFVMNDWKLATSLPDEQSCYNLFELLTGNGSEHWGIYVYHSLTRPIKVFRNGVDVSEDTTIVFGGKFGFGLSPLKSDSLHTMYEFCISVKEGAWHLFLADPGPSSFCSAQKSTNSIVEFDLSEFGKNVKIIPNPLTSNFENALVEFYSDRKRVLNIALIDNLGRKVQVKQGFEAQIGENKVFLNFAEFGSGQYYLEFSSSDMQETVPMRIVR